jgi:hypothetical protein
MSHVTFVPNPRPKGDLRAAGEERDTAGGKACSGTETEPMST